MNTNAVPASAAACISSNPASLHASSVIACATAFLSSLITVASSPTSPSIGSAIATDSNLSLYPSIASTISSYSAPCIRCVGCTTRFLTPLSTARSSACCMLSITSLSLASTWLIIICAVNARLTDQSGYASARASSIPLISSARLSLKDVPKLTTRSSFSPISSWLRGSSLEASPVSRPKYSGLASSPSTNSF